MSESTKPAYEAALIVVVPEVESLVAPFRAKYVPPVSLDIPAHITINYPFLPGASTGGAPEAKLRALFRRFRSFDFTLANTARWPGVVYLAVNPREPFTAMIDEVAREFSESPPYGGAFSPVTPHLTVIWVEDSIVFEQAAADFESAARLRLPIACRVEDVWLIDNREGRWEKRLCLPLSP